MAFQQYNETDSHILSEIFIAKNDLGDFWSVRKKQTTFEAPAYPGPFPVSQKLILTLRMIAKENKNLKEGEGEKR